MNKKTSTNKEIQKGKMKQNKKNNKKMKKTSKDIRFQQEKTDWHVTILNTKLFP